MIEKKLQSLSEIIVGSSDSSVANLLARLKREGHAVRLAPRLYTTNLTEAPETIEASNAFSDDEGTILRF